MLSRLKTALRALLCRPQAERELDEELRYHIEQQTEQNIRLGMSPEEARRAAQKSFGGVEQTKERSRDARGVRWLEDLWQDLRYGARMLVKNPGFTLVAVITLALGIGANTAIFSVVNGVLLRPLPYKDPQRLVMVFAPRRLDQESLISSGGFTVLRGQNQVFEQVAAFLPMLDSSSITGDGDPEFLGGVTVSANLFTLLGVEAKYGRTFLPEEEKPGANRVVVLSHHLWQRRFGSDQKIVGRTISLNNEPYTVVGVMPPGFQFPLDRMLTGWLPREIDIYIPLALTPEEINNQRKVLPVIARLKSQVSIEQAQIEMTGVAARIKRQYPDTNIDESIRLAPYHQQMVGRVRLALLVLLGAVGFVLLIACANVANLLLARAAGRRKEIAVRVALGAGRWRVIRQLLTENVLLAMLSGLLALLLAFWGVGLLQTIIPENLPRADEIGIDGGVFGFTLLISLGAGILFGLVPTFHASRVNLNDALKDGGRSSGGSGHNHLRNLLVVSEVALALALLIGAGLMLRSFIRLISVDPGLDPRNVLTVDIKLSRSKYSRPQQAVFFQQLLERLRALPGIQAAGAVYPMPLSGMEEDVWFDIEGQPPPAPGEHRTAGPRGVSPGYFKAQGIQLLKGRVFTESDGGDTPPVVVINEALARRYWPNQDPVGRRVSFDSRNGQSVWSEIVGVVKSVRHMALSEEPRSEIYIPFTQHPLAFMTLVARTDGAPLNFVATVRSQVQAVDKDQPISNVRTMEERLASTVSQRRFSLILLAIFAGLALSLAAIGIYGVMSYLVTQRRHEIGVRMALGAQTGDVLRLVIRQGMALALTGVLIGLIAAFGLTRLLKSLLFDLSATDPLTFFATALLLALAALLACYLPARRATKVDPVVALRCD
ncbi:MAG TPA: ABC transporter permease [Blastocatellia bacterium]|nr:ABC transporter permease [Blastocatellia bacterium]